MICQASTKSGGACSFKASVEVNGKHLCKVHAKTEQKFNNQEKEEPKSTKQREKFWTNFLPEDKRKPDPTKTPKRLTPEERSFMNMVNKFLASNLDPSDMKKQGRALLLKIHPDKNKFINLDAHVITQNIISHMNNS